MKCEQICNLLLETASNQEAFAQVDRHQSFDIDLLNISGDGITSRLYQILNTLEQQKNQFISQQNQQNRITIEKINIEKDQIIEDLLKSIYNLKKQNQQLRFQYRKRFKIIKNIQEKYQNLVLSKNKKINHLDSIVKYLEGKIKRLQKKLSKYENHFTKEICNSKVKVLSKSPSTNLSPNNTSVIIPKDKFNSDSSKLYFTKNSLDDLTVPLTSSFVSMSKLTSSSKTIPRNTRNTSKGKQDVSYFRKLRQSDFREPRQSDFREPRQSDFREPIQSDFREPIQSDFREPRQRDFREPRQSDFYSSFLGLTDYFNDKVIETETVFGDNSRITPVCLENHPSISTSKYLTLQDFTELDTREQKSMQKNSLRKSQQTNQNIYRDKWNFLKQHY